MISIIFSIGVVLVMSRFSSMFCGKYLGQPNVTSEMLSGILLGPTFLGYFFPDIYDMIFPKNIKHALQTFSQVALIFYMFSVGVDFNKEKVSGLGKKMFFGATVTGIVSPILCGIVIFILFPSVCKDIILVKHNSQIIIPLVFGLAFSVTALPMLARILDEKQILKSRIGSLAIFCAVIEDLGTWFLLTLLLFLVYDEISYVVNFVLCVVFILLVLVYVFPRIISSKYFSSSLFIGMIFLLAEISEHAKVFLVFSSFLVGLIVTKNKEIVIINDNLNYTAKNFLLPIFFAYSGLNTNLLVIFNNDLVGFTLLVVLFAFLSKALPAFLLATYLKENRSDSILFAILINSRGLMELIFLNILLQNNIIGPEFFAIMVVVTLVTTFITMPVINRLRPIANTSMILT